MKEYDVWKIPTIFLAYIKIERKYRIQGEKPMRTEKTCKTMFSILGLFMVMMTAASVTAEVIPRENQNTDEIYTTDVSDVDETLVEPNLISPEPYDTEEYRVDGNENETTDKNDDSYTEDWVISPNPAATTDADKNIDLPVIGILGIGVLASLIVAFVVVKNLKK